MKSKMARSSISLLMQQLYVALVDLVMPQEAAIIALTKVLSKELEGTKFVLML